MSLNVLIVDDSAAIRKILQRLLVQADVGLGDTFEASDGLEALAQLRAQSVDLVLSDINMPQLDGFGLLEQIRATAAWSTLPVIMVSTEGGQEQVMRALHLGANGYVRKPFTAEQIKEKLESLAMM